MRSVSAGSPPSSRILVRGLSITMMALFPLLATLDGDHECERCANPEIRLRFRSIMLGHQDWTRGCVIFSEGGPRRFAFHCSFAGLRRLPALDPCSSISIT